MPVFQNPRFDFIRQLLVKHELMDLVDHALIGEQLMMKLVSKGITSCMKCSLSGSAYVFIQGSRQVIRISNHGKHRGWFRYNIRSDLKHSREFRYSGQRVFIFTTGDLRDAVYRISKDYANEKLKKANCLVKKIKKRRGEHAGAKKRNQK